MRHPVVKIVLGAATVAMLAGCSGVTAATTPAPVPKPSASHTTAPATPAPAPVTTTPAPAPAPAPVAATNQPCAQLFANSGGNLWAVTYAANACDSNGTPIQLTGDANTPAGRFIAYPGGLTLTLAEVQSMPNSYGSAVATGASGSLEPAYTLVRVDLTVTNTGTAPANIAALSTMDNAFTLLYGDATSAPVNPGIIDATNSIGLVHQATPPTVAVPGARADIFESFSVPTADLASMSLGVDPDATAGYSPYRMTNLAAVMVPFH